MYTYIGNIQHVGFQPSQEDIYTQVCGQLSHILLVLHMAHMGLDMDLDIVHQNMPQCLDTQNLSDSH